MSNFARPAVIPPRAAVRMPRARVNNDLAQPPADRFMSLFLANHRRLYGLLASMVPNTADADDLIQDVAADMWRKFDQYDGRDFAAWGLGFARHAVLKYFERRRSQRRVSFDEDLVRTLCDEVAAVARDEADPREEALRRCLTRLPEKSRRLIDLRYAPGATVKSIAAQVGQSADAVYKACGRIHRALLDCVERTLAAEGVRR